MPKYHSSACRLDIYIVCGLINSVLNLLWSFHWYVAGKIVFGVPFSVNVYRTGHSLPKPILSAISHLRQTGMSAISNNASAHDGVQGFRPKKEKKAAPHKDDIHWFFFNVCDESLIKLVFFYPLVQLLTCLNKNGYSKSQITKTTCI